MDLSLVSVTNLKKIDMPMILAFWRFSYSSLLWKTGANPGDLPSTFPRSPKRSREWRSAAKSSFLCLRWGVGHSSQLHKRIKNNSTIQHQMTSFMINCKIGARSIIRLSCEADGINVIFSLAYQVNSQERLNHQSKRPFLSASVDYSVNQKSPRNATAAIPTIEGYEARSRPFSLLKFINVIIILLVE